MDPLAFVIAMVRAIAFAPTRVNTPTLQGLPFAIRLRIYELSDEALDMPKYDLAIMPLQSRYRKAVNFSLIMRMAQVCREFRNEIEMYDLTELAWATNSFVFYTRKGFFTFPRWMHLAGQIQHLRLMPDAARSYLPPLPVDLSRSKNPMRDIIGHAWETVFTSLYEVEFVEHLPLLPGFITPMSLFQYINWTPPNPPPIIGNARYLQGLEPPRPGSPDTIEFVEISLSTEAMGVRNVFLRIKN